MIRNLPIVLLVLVTMACAAPEPVATEPARAEATVVYLVRHAETTPPPDEEDPPDPGLSPEGRARAEALAALLAPERIDSVFSTDTRRTRATAAPLAEALGRSVQPYDPRDLEGLAARLADSPGRHVVVGHSNTTPALVELLGGDPGEPIDERREYDRLYVLVLGDAGVTTLRLRYGTSPGQPAIVKEEAQAQRSPSSSRPARPRSSGDMTMWNSTSASKVRNQGSASDGTAEGSGTSTISTAPRWPKYSVK